MTQNTKDAGVTEEEITAACTAYTRASGVLRDVIRDVLIASRKASVIAPTAEQADAVRPCADDARYLVALDRRDLWDHVRGAIHAALNDTIPKDCVVSWAWEEATNRTMDIFQKIVDTTPAQPCGEDDDEVLPGKFYNAEDMITALRGGEDAANGAMGERAACDAAYAKQSGNRRTNEDDFGAGWEYAIEWVQAQAASPQATATQPAQSPDGRVIDKAMVKRLAVQHGLLPVQPSLTDGIRKLIECAADCISEAVTWEQSGFDTPPMPATEWDYNADQLAYVLRALLAAARPASGGDHD